MKNVLKFFICFLLAFALISTNSSIFALEDNNKGDSFYISENEIKSVKKAYKENKDKTFTGNIFFKVFHVGFYDLNKAKTFYEVSLDKTVSYLFSLGQNNMSCISLYSDGTEERNSAKGTYTQTLYFLYEVAKKGRELLLSAENLGVDDTLEILGTYCFYPPTGPTTQYCGVGFETNLGMFFYYTPSPSSYYGFLLPMDVFQKAADLERELFPPYGAGYPDDIGTHYDLSEYAIGDYSPPKAPEPEPKFNLLHLIWIIPSSLAILGGGAFIGVYLIKKKRKGQENT